MFGEKEKNFLNSKSIARMATVSATGEPHNVPVGYIFEEPKFIITSDPGAKKVKNLRSSRNVALLIDDPAKPRKGLLIHGEAEVLERGPEFEKAIDATVSKRGWRRWKEGEQVAIVIRPRKKVSWGIE